MVRQHELQERADLSLSSASRSGVEGAQSVSDGRCSNVRCHVEAIAAVRKHWSLHSIERGTNGCATSDANV